MAVIPRYEPKASGLTSWECQFLMNWTFNGRHSHIESNNLVRLGLDFRQFYLIYWHIKVKSTLYS